MQKIDNQLVWDFVKRNGLEDLSEDERMEVYYDKKSNELFAFILKDWIYLNLNEIEDYVFIYSFDNLKRYWEKKKDKVTIDLNKLQKLMEVDSLVWRDFVLAIYRAELMEIELPKI